MDSIEENTEYVVVVNDEGQYSIWPAERNLPAGWRATSTRGAKKVCLEYIDATWTDMRPLSLQKAMASIGR